MTLPDRATVQQVGRPQFQRLLGVQGRPVVLRRPARPDVTTMGNGEPLLALLVPLTDPSREGLRPGEEQTRSLAWKVFLRHDVDAVRDGGFTIVAPAVQGQPDLILTPNSPAVDVMDQGVVFLVLCTALAERTRTATLTFAVPGVGVVLQPGTNNRMPAPGMPLTVAARLAATTDPRVRDSVGADTADVVLVGRWGSLLDPGARPSGVRWGSRSPLSINGQPGTLTITLAYPDSDLATEQQFGERFLAVWRAGGPP